MVLTLKKSASLLCTFGLLLFAMFLPAAASASTVNTELADNPTALMDEIGKIGLPLSDEMAGKVRGEGSGLETFVYLWKGSLPFRTYLNSYVGYNQFGWELGRLISYAEGNSDPGQLPNEAFVNKVVYWIANNFSYRFF